MGSILERVQSNVERASDIEKKGLEYAEQDAQEVSEINQILDGMDKAVDDDILDSMEAVEDAARSEGAEHMNTEVHGELEEGYAIANDAIAEGMDQAARSEGSAAEFASMSSVSEFGSDMAEQSAEKAEQMAEDFAESAEMAQEEMDSAEDRFQSLLDEILG